MNSHLPLFNIKNLYNYLEFKGIDNNEVIETAIALVNEFEGDADELIEVVKVLLID